MKVINLVFLLAAVSMVSCSHGVMRGSVAMKTSANEAHVCIGDHEAKIGDRITAFANSCPSKGGRDGGPGMCEKKRLGEGTVTALLNHHYSVVKFDDGVKFDEGTFVEKR
ncbi:MAG: hypothetical protein K2X47_09955 [Bdellovibrionales bacterium]|nr:hypothetical protein [Bdellovibrionales bacterium]